MLQAHVSSVSDAFVGMFQVFHADVAKVDRNVTYVAMIVHVCCRCLFPMFHLFFQTYVASVFIWMSGYVLHICCKCFIWILHMSAIVFQVFSCVSNVCFECFSCFVRMLQFFNLDVSKIDWGCRAYCNVSHLPQPLAAAARVLCMEGSGAAGVEGHGKQGSVGYVRASAALLIMITRFFVVTNW
jgi:hypothetical protein